MASFLLTTSVSQPVCHETALDVEQDNWSTSHITICSLHKMDVLSSELLCKWQSVSLGLEPHCDRWPAFSCNWTSTELMSWGVFPHGRTGLSSLFDPLLQPSSFDSLWSVLQSTLSGILFTWPSLDYFSLDPLWILLCSTLYWSLVHLAPSGFLFTWPSLDSLLLDPLLESGSLGPLWILVHLTLSGFSFTRPSTGVWFTWPPLDSCSPDPLWFLLCLTLYWSLLVWVSLSLSNLQRTVSQSRRWSPSIVCLSVGCVYVHSVSCPLSDYQLHKKDSAPCIYLVS